MDGIFQCLKNDIAVSGLVEAHLQACQQNLMNLYHVNHDLNDTKVLVVCFLSHFTISRIMC